MKNIKSILLIILALIVPATMQANPLLLPVGGAAVGTLGGGIYYALRIYAHKKDPKKYLKPELLACLMAGAATGATFGLGGLLLSSNPRRRAHSPEEQSLFSTPRTSARSAESQSLIDQELDRVDPNGVFIKSPSSGYFYQRTPRGDVAGPLLLSDIEARFGRLEITNDGNYRIASARGHSVNQERAHTSTPRSNSNELDFGQDSNLSRPVPHHRSSTAPSTLGDFLNRLFDFDELSERRRRHNSPFDQEPDRVPLTAEQELNLINKRLPLHKDPRGRFYQLRGNQNGATVNNPQRVGPFLSITQQDIEARFGPLIPKNGHYVINNQNNAPQPNLQNNERENEQDEDANTCVICMANEVNCKTTCCIVAYCKACINRCNNKCPNCRNSPLQTFDFTPAGQ